ncbi:MAG: hypothetical protein CL561_01690 [Alphaproteobacteria bacterium]|nr:hypothetical protein [Alphaproteobacteria bacterium]|tara:strand:+ start:5822 stop:6295 length:474 start_codon:yes stop_codon:yes gene_type:complete
MSRKDRLANISLQELNSAQEELDVLCKKFGLKPWKITAKKANWKELCLRMTGIPAVDPKSPGRKRLDEAVVDEIGLAVDIYLDFVTFDKNGNEIETPHKTKEDLFEIIAEMKGIKPRLRPSGEESSPTEIVRGIYYNRYKKEYPERLHLYRNKYSGD